jgi:hypothetical protein
LKKLCLRLPLYFVQNQQYQLDIYRSPCHSRCKGLILLETFTTLADEELLASLPPFLRYT